MPETGTLLLFALCRAVADAIPGALFEIMPAESHQPFQEVPEEWNARVDEFWRGVEGLNSTNGAIS